LRHIKVIRQGVRVIGAMRRNSEIKHKMGVSSPHLVCVWTCVRACRTRLRVSLRLRALSFLSRVVHLRRINRDPLIKSCATSFHVCCL
jgi:hypothetical protein